MPYLLSSSIWRDVVLNRGNKMLLNPTSNDSLFQLSTANMTKHFETQAYKIGVGLALAPIMLIGNIMNLLLMYVLYFKGEKQHMNVKIIYFSLAISDIVVTAFIMPLEAGRLVRKWLFIYSLLSPFYHRICLSLELARSQPIEHTTL